MVQKYDFQNNNFLIFSVAVYQTIFYKMSTTLEENLQQPLTVQLKVFGDFLESLLPTQMH